MGTEDFLKRECLPEASATGGSGKVTLTVPRGWLDRSEQALLKSQGLKTPKVCFGFVLLSVSRRKHFLTPRPKVGGKATAWKLSSSQGKGKGGIPQGSGNFCQETAPVPSAHDAFVTKDTELLCGWGAECTPRACEQNQKYSENSSNDDRTGRQGSSPQEPLGPNEAQRGQTSARQVHRGEDNEQRRQHPNVGRPTPKARCTLEAAVSSYL